MYMSRYKVYDLVRALLCMVLYINVYYYRLYYIDVYDLYYAMCYMR